MNNDMNMPDPRTAFQVDAISTIVDGFQSVDRGQCISPCGTGKTRIGIGVFKVMCGDRAIVFAPTLALVKQNLDYYAALLPSLNALVVCSDATAVDDARSKFDIPDATTDVSTIRTFLTSESGVTLFCTYKSAKRVSEALAECSIGFDLGVFDEAHNCAGPEGLFSYPLHDRNIVIKKRLFLTATPRSVRGRKRNDEIAIASMDDVAVFGKELFHCSFGRAIEKSLLTDYKVIICPVTKPEVKEWIEESDISRERAAQIALMKAVSEFQLKKVFPYFSTLERTRRFCSPNGFPHIFKEMSKGSSSLTIDWLEGSMSLAHRREKMRRFESSELFSVLASCKCLSEGVDSPSVDCVAFMDPKSSVIEIVQAAGRAMRLRSGKLLSYIFVPVFIETGSSDDIVGSAEWGQVWNTLEALRSGDERVEAQIMHWRDAHSGRAATSDASPIEFVNFSTEQVRSIQVRAIEVIRWMATREEFIQELKTLPEFPSSQSKGMFRGRTWETWQSYWRNRGVAWSEFRVAVTGKQWGLKDTSLLDDFVEKLKLLPEFPASGSDEEFNGKAWNTWAQLWRKQGVSWFRMRELVTGEVRDDSWRPTKSEFISELLLQPKFPASSSMEVFRGRTWNAWANHWRGKKVLWGELRETVTGESQEEWHPTLEEFIDALRVIPKFPACDSKERFRGKKFCSWVHYWNRHGVKWSRVRELVTGSPTVKKWDPTLDEFISSLTALPQVPSRYSKETFRGRRWEAWAAHWSRRGVKWRDVISQLNSTE